MGLRSGGGDNVPRLGHYQEGNLQLLSFTVPLALWICGKGGQSAGDSELCVWKTWTGAVPLTTWAVT